MLCTIKLIVGDGGGSLSYKVIILSAPDLCLAWGRIQTDQNTGAGNMKYGKFSEHGGGEGS